MKLLKTKIKGPCLIKTKLYRDKRGFLKETFRNNLFKNIKFPFDVMSYSKKNVLRGMHLQTKNSQAKIITVTNGKIFDVAVDLRVNSKTFGKYVSIIISDQSDYSFYIPSGFAHGFVCLSKECTINYKCSDYRNSKYERTLSWNDKKINIKWPIKKPILSNKDNLQGMPLNELKKEITNIGINKPYQIFKKKSGSLIPFSLKEDIPFKTKRIFIINGNQNYIRADHAHFKCSQYFVVLSGKIELEYENLRSKKKIILNINSKKGFLLNPMNWCKIKFLAKNSVVMVFCDREYEFLDYIDNYENFREIIKLIQ
jgi:dTDP-4-dehydrorhamnose 3,5-epimerase